MARRMGRSMGFGLAALALVAGAGVRAEDAKPADAKPTGPTISGFVDGTYSYDMRNPAGRFTNGRSYDAVPNTFRLDTAHVSIAGALGDVNYVIETDAGTDAALNHSAGLPSTATLTDTPTGDTISTASDTAKQGFFDLQEAYVTFKDPIAKMMGIDILVKAGKFATPEGIEVIESGSNPTISRGYLYGLAEPFTHTGMLMSWTGGPVTLSGGIVNGMDQIQDLNSPKMGLWIVNFSLGSMGAVNLSGCAGAEQPDGPGSAGRVMDSNDLTAVLKFIPMVDLNLQANYRDEQQATGGVNKQGGAGLQPLIHFSDAVALGLRLEYYELKVVGTPYGPSVLGSGTSSVAVTNETATLAWSFAKNMTLRWEVRHDDAGTPMFEDSFANIRHSTLTLGTEFLVTF